MPIELMDIDGHLKTIILVVTVIDGLLNNVDRQTSLLMDFLRVESPSFWSLMDFLLVESPSITVSKVMEFLTLKSPSITVKQTDGLFTGRKSINLLIDGLSTSKKSISPGFGDGRTWLGLEMLSHLKTLITYSCSQNI